MVAGCAGSLGSTPGPTIIPAPTGGAPLTAGQLRLLLIDTFGPRWYCDPDVYPVAHGTEQDRALERFAEMQAEGDVYRHVAAKLGINLGGPLTDAEKLAIYQVWKVALSIPLDPVGDGTYRFDYLAQPAQGATSGTRTGGVIDSNGRITIDQQASSGEPMCPICLARGTLIDTPSGEIAVDRLRLGDPVWTLDGAGDRIAGTVIALGSTTAPADHRVIRLTLADGRSVTASPGHPLADGRTFGELAVGDAVDGSSVTGLVSLPYAGGETFDLVASGPTGIYLSSGIALGSTLAPAR
ncbi:MAG TPA: Hint domain-containing protein [Candidatus Dormibacteraeota bacterium]|nr:Hint domain-containing protein [Candidatus Dormibacteraeota bacterium]